MNKHFLSSDRRSPRLKHLTVNALMLRSTNRTMLFKNLFNNLEKQFFGVIAVRNFHGRPDFTKVSNTLSMSTKVVLLVLLSKIYIVEQLQGEQRFL